MKVTVRLLVAIWIVALLVIGAFTFVHVRQERERLVADLARRGALIGEGVREAVEPAARRGSVPVVTRVVRRLAQPGRRIIVFDGLGSPIASAPGKIQEGLTAPPEVTEAISSGAPTTGLRRIDGARVYIYATPILSDGDKAVGAVATVLDASGLDAILAEVWPYNALWFVALAAGLSVITGVVVRATITRPLSEMAGWTKALKAGNASTPPDVADAGLFGPLAVEVAGLARSLYRAQAVAEQEAALRLSGEAIWTEERLKQFARARFDGQPLFVVSNREPVSHVFRNGTVVAQTPASGVVTAMEPVMRACGGTWLAHGSGDADWEVVDERGRLRLPEDDPRYSLRRLRLSTEEEDGYYYGFSNEGLWPLCHVVHARPRFQSSDWERYQAVNHKFAAALLDEMEGCVAPMVLIQDYHFALLPALVKAARPDARVAIFWHIPWPNCEAFAICPWQHDILKGMLGADLIGFHTQYHCNNFFDTVDRAMEVRIDAEHFAVVRGEHRTSVQPFPISVAPQFLDEPVRASRAELLAELGPSVEFLGVGVDRVDYTKGLPERFLAIRRFFEQQPEYRERLAFVQIAAPSRSRIGRYQELQHQIRETVAEVNQALGTRSWRPILYRDWHHERADIAPFYRHADFCMVTALHDGMNLVAKEFVAARADGDGVLILSEFTGAARELRDALVVNPYDVDATAEAIRLAVEMPAGERAARMGRMHRTVLEHNIYRWAGLLLGELSRIPVRPAAAPGGDSWDGPAFTPSAAARASARFAVRSRG
ncbi:MAG TPA: trehalose-6-phosphate synthase [Methylomirabilota bacterium]